MRTILLHSHAITLFYSLLYRCQTLFCNSKEGLLNTNKILIIYTIFDKMTKRHDRKSNTLWHISPIAI